MRVFVVHYSEIALKGKNRIEFERKLIENIRRKIERIEKCRIKRRYGRIIIESDNEKISEKLKKIPGIKYFALAEVSGLDIEEIKEKACSLPLKGETFKVETKRSNKKFPLTSIDVNRIVGKYIADKKNLKVDLKMPDTKIYIEICEKESYIYTEKIYGVGGLPCGISGKVISLLSGIKSFFATFLMMKRGAEITAINFSNTDEIIDFAKKLSEFHRIKLIIIPKDVERAEMIEISNEIAERENAKAIVVGDVLSNPEELEELSEIYSKSPLPILTPTICFNSGEIKENVKKIDKIAELKIKGRDLKKIRILEFDC